MTFTPQQQLRKMRARNKGLNRRLAANLRTLAMLMEKKGPEEFTSREVRALKGLRTILSQRLFANALTQSAQDIWEGKPKAKYDY